MLYIFFKRPVKPAAMAEHPETTLTQGTPPADTYPRKILEYLEGFLISKVTLAHTHSLYPFFFKKENELSKTWLREKEQRCRN